MTKAPKSILLIGGTGSIGQFLRRYLLQEGFQVTVTSRREVHIRPGQHASALQTLGATKADLIVNLAGYVREQSLALPAAEVVDLNSLFPQNAARHFAELGTPMVHISTDCVFSGKKGPYSESSVFDTDEIYGLSKAAADGAPCMVLRGSYLGPGLPPNKYGLLEWILGQGGKKLSGFTNQMWNGITYLTLGRVIAAIAQGRYETGVFHLPSAHEISRYDLIRLVSDSFNLGIQVEPDRIDAPVQRLLRTEKPLFQEILSGPIKAQVAALARFPGLLQTPSLAMDQTV